MIIQYFNKQERGRVVSDYWLTREADKLERNQINWKKDKDKEENKIITKVS